MASAMHTHDTHEECTQQDVRTRRLDCDPQNKLNPMNPDTQTHGQVIVMKAGNGG